MTGRVYVVGSANMDLVVRAPRLPRAGETVLGADLLQVPGGKGANQAVAAARLGASVAFVGCVGDDAFGASLRTALANEGVDVQHLTTAADRATGVALIVVDAAGENLIAVGSGANHALAASHVDATLTSLQPTDLLLAQLEAPPAAVARACATARSVGARVLLNAAPATPDAERFLPELWGLIVNASEAEILAPGLTADAAARDLQRRGPSIVLVTQGAAGALLADAEGVARIDPFHVDVVDTTAAGDAFCGALAAALLEGQSPARAARFASAAAALATTRMGAQVSLPSRAQVDARLAAA